MFNGMSIVVCSTIPYRKVYYYNNTTTGCPWKHTPVCDILSLFTLRQQSYGKVIFQSCVSVCLFSTPRATPLWTCDITVQGLPPSPTHHYPSGQRTALPHCAGDPQLPPGSDIWWSRLATCSNRFTWGLFPWHLVAVVRKREVRILLECFLVFSMYYSKGRRNDNIIHCITRP